MEFAESLSRRDKTTEALDEILSDLKENPFVATPDVAPPDLGFLFFSHDHVEEAEEVVRRIRAETGVRTLLGCTGESIIGGGSEVERAPSMCLWLASLPGARVTSFEFRCDQTQDGFTFPLTPEDVFRDAGEDAVVLLLGEPFTLPVDVYIRRLNEEYPGLPVVGGMASGAAQPGKNRLVRNDAILPIGAVGVVISGGVEVRTVVSQGCRPVGKPMVVTACDRNALQKLGGQPAIACLQELFSTLSPEDRQLFQSAPHIGIVMNERQDAFRPGDFLIRNVIGVDQDKGALFIGDYLRRGQTVQFHVRDGQAASDDFAALLATEQDRGASAAVGGLIFSCNGRGTRLFQDPHHDITAVHTALGRIPMAGFFAQGELGPVGEKNHLHGFTTCLALFSNTAES